MHSAPPPAPRDPAAASRRVLLATLRDLQRSAGRRRPISLPNLGRLLLRRCAAVHLEDATLRQRLQRSLRRLYLAEQPFRHTDWQRLRQRA